jgi:hypothetical protein
MCITSLLTYRRPSALLVSCLRFEEGGEALFQDVLSAGEGSVEPCTLRNTLKSQCQKRPDTLKSQSQKRPNA